MSPMHETTRAPKAKTLPRLRVLLAEHSPVLRDTLRKHLQRLGFVEVIGEAHKGQEALDLFFRTGPDAVVLSISIPDQGGFEVLRTLRQAGAAVILTHPSHDPFVRDVARLLGATGACVTTDGFAELTAIFHRILEKNLIRA